MNAPGAATNPAALQAQLQRVWANPRGWRALSAVNHTTIALRFMATGLAFFLIAGVLAMLMRTQLALPGQAVLGAQAYQQAFTAHGTMMMFLFAVPMVEGLACYLIPKMIGARDLAFPRLGAFGYWCYLFGGLIFTASVVAGMAPEGGWFMYTPLSGPRYSPGIQADFWLIAITLVEISSVAGAVELLVSILRTRAAGMSLQRMPLFAWYILVTSVMILLGFPPLILGSVLLELERAAGWAFFDTARGGDPLLWQHLFWLFGHPEVYIIFLPAAGVVSTLVPVFARRPLVSYRWTVVAVIATGFISFGLWVHHMFAVGIPPLALAFFSAASMLVAVPTSIQIFVWLATLWTGRVQPHLPMLWLLGFLVVFVAGGLTGVMLALVPFDWQVHDTHFVVAHLHYVLVGGFLFPLLAGVYHWLPLATGRMPTPWLARWGFWLTFVGFNGTFLVMHWAGLLGMPRRVYTYAAGLGWSLPNLVSSLFGFVMAVGIAMVLLDVATHARVGRRAPRNPWGADTLEWACAMPAAPYNFASQPRVESRHPLWDDPGLLEGIEQGRHALSDASHGRRETLGTEPVDGEPREVIHLPGNSWWPLVAAGLLAALCIALLAKAYAAAGLAAAAALGALTRWSWENGAHPNGAASAEAGPAGLPLHWRTCDGPGRWGLGAALLADAALYGSLVFGWVYLWVVAPGFEPPEQPPVAAAALVAHAVLATLGAVPHYRVQARLRRGCEDGLVAALAGAALVGAVQCLWMAVLLARAPLAPEQRAHDAVVAVLLIFALVHGGVATVATALQALRARRRYVGAFAPYEPVVLGPLWAFQAGIAWATLLAITGVPAALGGWR